MAIVLEVKAGPMAGEKIVIRQGETVTFGRAAGRANFALPHDTFMSGVHFAVESGPQGPFLRDKNSSNGTFLNGARVKDSPLTNGDEIRTGQTSFSVRLVADDKLAAAPPAPPVRPPTPEPPRRASLDLSAEPRATARPKPDTPMPSSAPSASPQIPRPTPPPPPVAPATPPPRAEAKINAPRAPFPATKPVFTVGSWAFSVVPQGWTVKDEFGMEKAEKDGFPSSLTATEEMVSGNTALGPFVESQLSMLRQYLREPKIEAAIPPAIPGAEEKASVDVRYSTNDGQTIFYRRLYARSGNTVGTVTLMTLDSEFAGLKPAFDAIVGGIAFQAKAPA
ncbi:MAG TPA: FHA domain-containing protein [Candidatus Acidoferrales bacterium]